LRAGKGAATRFGRALEGAKLADGLRSSGALCSALGPDTDRRLVLLGALLLPWHGLLAPKPNAGPPPKPNAGPPPTPKAKAKARRAGPTSAEVPASAFPVGAARHLVTEALKLRTKDGDDVERLHGAGLRLAGLAARPRSRLEAGLALREAGQLWREALLVAATRAVSLGDAEAPRRFGQNKTTRPFLTLHLDTPGNLQ
jgi:hypothetical protein